MKPSTWHNGITSPIHCKYYQTSSSLGLIGSMHYVVLHLKNLCVTNGNITTVSVIQYTTVYPSCIQINN